MPLTLHYLSGSPYTWRVHMALELKQIPHALRPMSYDAGDFRKPEIAALNPRRRLPVIEHDGFVLYESAAILEHLVEAVLFTPPDQRDTQRIAEAQSGLRAELALWETLIEGEFLAGDSLSAADVTLYPLVALARRIASRNPGLVAKDLAGPRIAAWMARMEALPVVRATWPPHWGAPPGA
jgi:glutathione S-transferase